VDDGAARALERLHGAADQVLARLGEHFDRHVVRNVAAFDQAAHEVEIGLRGGRKRHFDFLEADVAQVRNMRILRSMFIGSNKAWLPSRKSVLIQIGGVVMVRLGHWRSDVSERQIIVLQ
jgi:hypothetical protein